MSSTSSLLVPDTNEGDICLFKIKTYYFDPIENHKIQEQIFSLLKKNSINALGPSLMTLIGEMFDYAIMENFRYIFMNFMIHEMGMEYLDVVEAEDLFQAELKSSRIENFRHHCVKNEVYSHLECLLDGDDLVIRVDHFGRLNSEKAKKIQKVVREIDRFSHEQNLHRLGEQSGIMDGYGKGLPLALFTFRGMGIPDEYFTVKTLSKQTQFTIRIPLHLYKSNNQNAIISQDSEMIKNLVWEVFDGLQLSMVRFDSHGSIIEISSDLLKILRMSETEIATLSKIIPENFFADIFMSPFSVHNFSSFENYRLTLPVNNSNQFCLFNVSGIKKPDSTVATLWQAVNIDTNKDKYNKGSLFENINMMRVITPYIPRMVMEKAKLSIKKGLNSLPVESENASIFFADLAGFTQKSETMSHHEIVELLNLTMTNIVSSIDRHSGYVDKFIGDGIMCIFFNPLQSIIAGIEIQNNLLHLNEFRKITGQPPLDLRIGINSGNVILGSIGTKDRMDWTALGDVVNTAARIEAATPICNVAISEKTWNLVKDNVTIKDCFTIKLKGKENEQNLFLVESVKFNKDGKNYRLELFNPETDRDLL